MAYNKRYADWSRKVWVEIYAPQKVFKEVFIGETPVYKDNIENIVGRIVDINLAFLTGNYKYQNYKGIFKIFRVSGLRAYTELVEISLYDAYVRRLARVGTSKIDDSFVVKTLDGYDVRVKPMIITRGKANRSQRRDLRNKYREYLLSVISRMEYYDLIEKIINYDIQNEIKPILNKIFPVSHVEIRRFILLSPLLAKENIEIKQ